MKLRVHVDSWCAVCVWFAERENSTLDDIPLVTTETAVPCSDRRRCPEERLSWNESGISSGVVCLVVIFKLITLNLDTCDDARAYTNNQSFNLLVWSFVLRRAVKINVRKASKHPIIGFHGWWWWWVKSVIIFSACLMSDRPPPIGGWGEVAVDVGEILTLAMDKVNELNQFERFAADGFLW